MEQQEAPGQRYRDRTGERNTKLDREAVEEIACGLRELLADVFTLYIKTKRFQWDMSAAHFRDYHRLLDEHTKQIFAMTDPIAELGTKIGGTTLRSIGDIGRHQRLGDCDDEFVSHKEMLMELRQDNRELMRLLRATWDLCTHYGDVASASLIETWVDETERRTLSLSERL
jgi:starvation-inducible DNA-binding protein